MSKRIFTVALSAALAWAVAATAADRLQIVTTTTDLASIAAAVAGERAVVRSICSGQEDPHYLQAKPSFIMMARSADLWIRVGLELEIGWEQPILDGSRNQKIRIGANGHLDASENALRLELPTGRIDRSMGDVHPLGNPHYWLDPYNGRMVARLIRDRLVKLDPAGASDYQANHAAFERRLDQAVFGTELVDSLGGEALWEAESGGRLAETLQSSGQTDRLGGWMGRLRPHRGAKVITYHRSWSYFTNRFGLIVAAELEPKPGIPPGPGHLAEAIEIARTGGALVIIQEPFYDRKGAEFVAARTGLPLVEIANTVGGQLEAGEYLAMLDNVVQRISSAIRRER